MKDKHRTKFVTKDIFKSSVIGAFTKLNPKYMMHNPVMFVVEIGFVIALLLSIFPELFGPTDGINNVRLYNIFVCVILFVTVLFANFAEAVAEGRCFGDWILLPLLCRPEAAPLRERAGVEVESLYTGDTSPWQVFIHDANDYGEAPKKEMLQAENASGHTEFDPAVLNYRYPYQRETQLPAKLTATQLKGRALDEEIAEDALHTPYIRPLTQPKFRQQDRGLTPAERGTATHLVLQYLDLRNPNVPEQVAALRLRAKLTPEQAAAVDIRALERFLSSPLAEEMRRVAAMEREYRFTVLMDARDYDGMSVGGDEILLQGVVDCWFETPDGLTVVDFKTDRVFTEEELTERAELYRGQLSAYTLALERVLERPVTRRVLYFLSVGRAVEVS